jgi:hypothetical protein
MKNYNITVKEVKDSGGNSIYNVTSKDLDGFKMGSCNLENAIYGTIDVIEGYRAYRNKMILKKVLIFILILIVVGGPLLYILTNP